jgi:acetylornithine/succinyldiaminopimelate/putrescine aminotransferase
VLEPGDHGSTFAAARSSPPPANAALDVLMDPDLHAACASSASDCARRCASCPRVVAVRGRGLIVAADLDTDGAAGPDVARRRCSNSGSSSTPPAR